MEHKVMEGCAEMMKAMKDDGSHGSGMMGMMGKGQHGMMGMGMGSRMGLASGSFLMRRLSHTFLSRPLAVFSLGAAAGAVLYKNRKGITRAFQPATKEVVRAVTKTGDAGRDFLQEQKEKLSDIVAEVKEEEEEKSKQESVGGEKTKLSDIIGEEGKET